MFPKKSILFAILILLFFICNSFSATLVPEKTYGALRAGPAANFETTFHYLNLLDTNGNGNLSDETWPGIKTAWDEIGNPTGASEIDFGANITELNVGDFRIGDGGSNYIRFWDDSGTIRLTQVGNSTMSRLVEIFVIVGDESTNLTAATNKLTMRSPYAFTLTEIRASVNTAPTGSTIIVDLNETGTTVLSTKISIDISEKTSVTAAVPPVISDSSIADDAEITIDIDQIGSGTAGTGLKIWIFGTRNF